MAKNIFVILICFLVIAGASAQSNFPVSYNQNAHYPKSDTALMLYFFKNIKYSDDAIKNNVKGTLQFRFTVRPDSTIKDVAPLNHIGYGLESQVAELISKLHFAPALMNNTPFSSTVIMEVNINADNYNKELIVK